MDIDSLITEKNNFLVVLDSRNATTYKNGTWNSSIIFNIESIRIPPSAIRLYCSVLQFTCPNSIYIINEYNNILSINSIQYSIPYGNYNSNNFMTTLLTILPAGYSITFNDITNKFTLSNSISFTISTNSTIGPVMGFINGSTYSGISIIMPFTCNFNGIQSFNICFSNLKTKNVGSFDKSTSSIIQPITVNAGSSFISFSKADDYNFGVDQTYLDYIQIDLLDDLERLINFNNQNWNLTLYFTILNDIERFNYRNNFYSILQHGYHQN